MWKKTIRQFDWAAIFGSALLLGLVLCFVFPGSGILSPETWAALATVVLAAATILLCIATYIAAKAAKAAAEIAPISERAYVFLKILDTSFGEFFDNGVQAAGTNNILSLRFTLCNHGRTPAIIRQILASLKPSRSTDDVVAKADDAEFLKIDGSEFVIEAGKELSRFFTVTSAIDGWYAYFAGRRVRLFGVVIYEDIFGKERETEFSLRFEGKPNGIFEMWPKEFNRRT